MVPFYTTCEVLIKKKKKNIKKRKAIHFCIYKLAQRSLICFALKFVRINVLVNRCYHDDNKNIQKENCEFNLWRFILNFGIWNTIYTKIVIVRLYYEYDNGTENYLCSVCRSAKASPLCHYTVVKLAFKVLDPWIRFSIYT